MEEMVDSQINALKEKSLKYSILDGASYSFMDGFGSRYITPYAVFMNLPDVFIGILSSVPALVGSLLQIKSLKLMEKKSRKKIVLQGVIIQAFMWIPLIGVSALYLFSGLNLFFSSVLVIISYTILVSAGSFAGPAWVSWMRELIPKNSASYFGKRNGIVGVVSLMSLLIAGEILNGSTGNLFFGFSILFLIAFLGRGFSAYFLSKHYEPKFNVKEGYYFSFFEFVREMPKNNFGKFVIFSSLVTFATAVASPFFAVYMLEGLHFGYIAYTLIIASSIISNMLFQPFWGRFADKFGSINTIKLCGFFIFLVPLLWVFSPLFSYSKFILVVYLFMVEFFSGFIWAGFDLSTGTFAYYAVTKERLALCSSYMSILVSIGSFFGALIGGFISEEGFILGFSAFLIVFFLSAILRFMIVQSFVGKLKETKEKVSDFRKEEIRAFFTGLVSREMQQGIGAKRV